MANAAKCGQVNLWERGEEKDEMGQWRMLGVKKRKGERGSFFSNITTYPTILMLACIYVNGQRHSSFVPFEVLTFDRLTSKLAYESSST